MNLGSHIKHNLVVYEVAGYGFVIDENEQRTGPHRVLFGRFYHKKNAEDLIGKIESGEVSVHSWLREDLIDRKGPRVEKATVQFNDTP